MAVRGPRPKPTLLKLIAGNPGRRPLNAREPVPPTHLRAPPKWFSDQQRESWEYVLEHAPHGLLKGLDRSTLVGFVVAENLHREAAEHVAAEGVVLKGLPRETKGGKVIEGGLYQSPWMAVLNRQALIMMKAAAELGFSPASRSRITLEPEEAGDDPARKYFK